MAIAPTRRHSLGALITAAIALCPALTWGGAQDVGRDLIEAARRGDAAEIARLLAQGVAVDARDGADRTALHHATEGNHIAAAVALIEAGADVNASDGASIDHTPYLMAGARGYLQHGPALRMRFDNFLAQHRGADAAGSSRFSAESGGFCGDSRYCILKVCLFS
jgi:hypothetical protein